jgi:hypothetical protein
MYHSAPKETYETGYSGSIAVNTCKLDRCIIPTGTRAVCVLQFETLKLQKKQPTSCQEPIFYTQIVFDCCRSPCRHRQPSLIALSVRLGHFEVLCVDNGKTSQQEPGPILVHLIQQTKQQTKSSEEAQIYESLQYFPMPQTRIPVITFCFLQNIYQYIKSFGTPGHSRVVMVDELPHKPLAVGIAGGRAR